MNDHQKTSAVLTGLTVLFAGLGLVFWMTPRGGTAVAHRVSTAGSMLTNTATVRLSVAELTQAGGDVSGLVHPVVGKALVARYREQNAASGVSPT